MKLQREDCVIHRSEVLENVCLGKSLLHVERVCRKGVSRLETEKVTWKNYTWLCATQTPGQEHHYQQQIYFLAFSFSYYQSPSTDGRGGV